MEIHDSAAVARLEAELAAAREALRRAELDARLAREEARQAQAMSGATLIAQQQDQLASHGLLRGVLDSATSGIMVLEALRDDTGRIVDFVFTLANPTSERMVGLRADEVLGRRLLELFPGNVASGQFAMYAEVTESGEAREIETHYQDDRLEFWLNVSAARVGDGVAVTFTDVSDRKRNERDLVLRSQELARQKAFAERVIANVTTGICYLDRDLVYRVANPVYCQFLQMAREQIVDRYLFDVVPGGEDTIEPIFRRALAHGEPTFVQAMPFTYVTPEGTSRQTYWDASYLPMKAADGEAIEGVLVLANEVSDRVEKERLQAERLHALQLLANQRAFAEKVLANVQGGVGYLDRELVFRFSNAPYARFLGSTPAGIVGRHLDDVAPGAVEQTGPWLHETMRTGVPFEQQNFCLVIREPDGTSRHTYWDFVYYPDEPDVDGVAKGVFVLANEISERLRAERERDEAQRERIGALEEANRHKEQFLSILSHELRTPVNAIMGFASVLDDEVVGPLDEAQHRYLGKILDSSDRMLALINDLLDMSRIQAGQFTVTFAPASLAAICRDAVATLQPLAEQKGQTMTCEANEGLPTVWADAQRIEQIVTNLLSNAIKFTPAGGAIRLRMALEADHVRVEVVDTGIGIPREEQARIFDAFTQVDMSNTRQAGGSGLGLAIARSLVEAHGGAVGVESEPGGGATFWFTLPLASGRP